MSSDADESDEDKSGNVDSNSDDSDGLENWDGVSTDEMLRDISAATPLPEPEKRKSKLQKVNALVFWLVYFLLI